MTESGKRIFFVTGASDPDVHGFFPRLVDTLQHLALPTISLVIISYAGYHMMQRSLLLDNLGADYVRTARAKGLTRGQAIRKHALGTSIIPRRNLRGILGSRHLYRRGHVGANLRVGR